MTGDPAIVGEYKFIRRGKDIVSAAANGAGGKALWRPCVDREGNTD